jgi:hypothetical protein
MKAKLNRYRKNDTRKVYVEIENHDTWSLDRTLALIILPGLLQLKDTAKGVPGNFSELAGGADYDNQDSFDFYKDSHNDAFDIACKEWEKTLDKMIWSFQQLALEDWDSQYHHGNAKFEWVKTDDVYTNPLTGKVEPTYQMVDTNPGEHWYDHEGAMLHRDRIQEGLDLFAKYYMNLWD